MQHHPITEQHRLHRGIDIVLPAGTPVFATGAGIVSSIDSTDGYGIHVRILHPTTGHLTIYAHRSSIRRPETIRRTHHTRLLHLTGRKSPHLTKTNPPLLLRRALDPNRRYSRRRFHSSRGVRPRYLLASSTFVTRMFSLSYSIF